VNERGVVSLGKLWTVVINLGSNHPCVTSIITRLDRRWLLSLRWEVNKDEKDQPHVAEEKAGSGRKAHNDYLYIFTPIFKVHARLTALKEKTAVHSRNLVF